MADILIVLGVLLFVLVLVVYFARRHGHRGDRPSSGGWWLFAFWESDDAGEGDE